MYDTDAFIPPSSPDMFILGFQEIVPLTAQQIVQTDPEKRYVHCLLSIVTRYLFVHRRVWETRILDTLDRRPGKKSNYVLLRSEQVCRVTQGYVL